VAEPHGVVDVAADDRAGRAAMTADQRKKHELRSIANRP
jgi:hypothetical protein